MNETNKTILLSVMMVCLTAFAVFALHVKTRPQPPASITADRFTHCIQVVMSESRNSGKMIDAEKAKDICVNVEGINKN